MRKKAVITLISVAVLFTGYMLFLRIMEWYVFPKVTLCRVCDKTVYFWQARRVYYTVHLNGNETDTFGSNGHTLRMYMSGFVHNSCEEVPVVNLRVEVTNNGFSVGSDVLRVKEKIGVIHIMPSEEDEEPWDTSLVMRPP